MWKRVQNWLDKQHKQENRLENYLAKMPNNISDKIANQIIVALDCSTVREAVSWCDRLPEVQFWKVGLELFISDGKAILAELKQRNKRVFLDLKLHDIPNTVAKACEVAATYDVDFLTVHATGGKQMLDVAAKAIASSSTKLLAVTLLTSLTSRELAFDLKVPIELPEYVLHLALMAQEAGLSGIVCSPLEVKELRTHLNPDFILVTPGIRLAIDVPGDQRRIMTPKAAIAAGADYLVIGRSILNATNPQAAWQECVAITYPKY
jgi:orotidine-5'-phosphate decarboxylase